MEIAADNLSADKRQMYAQARLSRDRRFDGRFFVAVRSTGIFCRPICPARLPLEKNVVYYEHASQALHNGFRPCLRCRPDSAPASYAWQGITTTVRRALALLSEIPQQSICDIATRLGISERYLNKLMQQAMGISAKEYQSFHRVLFAKALLQQTQMSIAEVAYSADYNSARQLQRAIQRYCKTTPSDLRTTAVTSDPAIVLRLSFVPPYNWPQVREFLALRAIEGIETVTLASYHRNIEVSGKQGSFTATYNEQAHGFDVRLVLPDIKELHGTLEKIKSLLDLNVDPHAIEQSLLKAGISRSAVVSGLRLPGTWDVFESGCRAIVGQQISVKAAIGQATLLANTLHQQQKSTPDTAVCFPNAQTVALSDLSFLRMPQSRKDTLKNFATFMANKDDNEPVDDDALLAIKGIGQWTLDYINMRGKKEPDIYLAGDLIVRKMVAKCSLSPEMAAPWRSYLTLQLWEMSKQ